MWVSPGSGATDYNEARLYKSTNKGANWQKANWAFTKSQDIIMPSILQYGKDYQGARDNFVYMYSIRLKDGSDLKMQKPGEVDLLRVPKSSIMDRNRYEFFKGLDTNGNPVWTTDISQKIPVFTQVSVGWAGPAVSYNPGLQRYILSVDYQPNSNTPLSGSGLAIYEAPEPWGPWSEIAKYSNWIYEQTFFYNIPTKWISSDGKTIYMVFTGTGTYDSFNIIKGTLKLKSTAPPPPPSPPPTYVSNFKVSNGKSYEFITNGMNSGATQYIDRTFVFTSIPSTVQGLTYLKTANDDKLSTGNNFLSFDTSQPLTIYVAHDDRYTTKPSWLSSYTITNDNIVSGAGTFSIYKKDFPVGMVSFGGNTFDGIEDKSMYTVILRTSSVTPPPPSPSPLPSNNLALNKPASSSSIQPDYKRYSVDPKEAVDGNLSSRWSSEFVDPQWISVDLGMIYNIEKVVLNWETAYGKAYDIQVSTDNVNWNAVYSTTNGDGNIDDITFTPTEARYVRMYGTQRGTQWGYSLYEFEVYEAAKQIHNSVFIHIGFLFKICFFEIFNYY